MLFATSYVLFVIDGAVHFLANVASSVAWLFVTTVLWVSCPVDRDLTVFDMKRV